MPDYLLGLSVGPVQGFIAAARRTRDLWFGSEVLSEISKAAALALYSTEGCRLIFPAPRDGDELQPGSGLNVGNKLMAQVATMEPATVLDAAKQAAREAWRTHAEQVKNEELSAEAIRKDTWEAQVDDVLELFGAWVLIGERRTDYKDARARLEQLLNARKVTRDFQQSARSFAAVPGFGLRKSSLDAARETVLTEALARDKGFRDQRRKLGLGSGEQLDCPGLVKRLGGGRKQFPPVTRVALEAWLEKVPEESLALVCGQYEHLVRAGIATRVKAPHFAPLPFDGGLLFPSRIVASRREVKEDEPKIHAALDQLGSAVERLHRDHGEPTPYFAVLVADGDRMGEFIDRHETLEAHIQITQALASFAGEAHGIVRGRKGACVYAGGDDVLAFLPIHTAVACARELRDAFARIVGGLDPKGGGLPTLSVGLGLGHVLTPLPRLLDLGRRAEKLAKDGFEGTAKPLQRNALALIVGVRSGAEIAVRGRWRDTDIKDKAMDERLLDWMRLYAGDRLSDKTPYDLREALDRMAWAKSQRDYADIATAEAERVLLKKRTESGLRELFPEDRALIVAALRREGLATVVPELLVARWLAQKTKE